MNRLRVLLVAGVLPFTVGAVVGRRRGRVAVVGVCALLAGCLALPSSGSASVTFGSSLTANANLGLSCGSACAETIANTSVVLGAPALTSPLTGTIVRWRLKTLAGGDDGNIQLRVLRLAGGGQFTGAGTSAGVAIPTTTTTTAFTTQLPINAGDVIGVDFTFEGNFAHAFWGMASGTGATMGQWLPRLADGGTAAPGVFNNRELLVNADVAALPTSNVAIPDCSATGTVEATVTPDPDPAVAPKAIHFRIDNGTEQTQATAGNPGSATIAVPNGSHALVYWGEDSVGGLESPHHFANVVGCTAPAGGTTTGGTTTGTSAGGPAGTIAPTLASNAFSIVGAKQLRDGSIQLALASPDAGGYQANATFTGKSRFTQTVAKRKPKTTTGPFGSAAANAQAAGPVTLLIRPTRRALATLRRTSRLTVSMTITFTPNDGNPSTQTRSISVKKLKANKKRPRR